MSSDSSESLERTTPDDTLIVVVVSRSYRLKLVWYVMEDMYGSVEDRNVKADADGQILQMISTHAIFDEISLHIY